MWKNYNSKVNQEVTVETEIRYCLCNIINVFNIIEIKANVTLTLSILLSIFIKGGLIITL